MKSLLKSIKVGSCVCFIIIIALASFTGCPSTPPPVPNPLPEPPEPPNPPPAVEYLQTVLVPFTDQIIEEFGGIEEMHKFDYYPSSAIILTLNLGQSGTRTIEGGIGIRNNTVAHDTILIRSLDKGSLRKNPPAASLGYKLNIDFKNSEGTHTIPFGRQGASNERYGIIYDDPAKTRIVIGGFFYTVTVIGDEPPYLMVGIREKVDASGIR